MTKPNTIDLELLEKEFRGGDYNQVTVVYPSKNEESEIIWNNVHGQIGVGEAPEILKDLRVRTDDREGVVRTLKRLGCNDHAFLDLSDKRRRFDDEGDS